MLKTELLSIGRSIAAAGNDDDRSCKVIIRSRYARSSWEKVCKAVVGDPVHMDVVLGKPQSHCVKVCYSAYVNQDFEMCLMDKGLVMDESMKNHCLDLTSEEFDRCQNFMQNLVNNKTKYDYADALLLMPLAPKAISSTDAVRTMVQDDFCATSNLPKKVFCSQSVLLMLRCCLDPNGIHMDLVKSLQRLNSRLTSPKTVHETLVAHPFTYEISNTELFRLRKLMEPSEASR